MSRRHGHIVATPRYTQWASELARALDEQRWLRRYETGFLWPSGAWGERLAGLAARSGPAAKRAVALRKRPTFGADVRSMATVDLLRTVAAAAKWRRLEDRVWEWDEHRFARAVARRLTSDVLAVHAFEHCALEILQRARTTGSLGVLHTFSVHPRACEELMDTVIAAEPQLRETVSYELHSKRGPRDARREREYALADIITAPSAYAARTLITNGVDAGKVRVIRFGGPAPIVETSDFHTRGGGLQFLYAGRIGAHKGCHHLAEAWRIANLADATLTFVGENTLPADMFTGRGVALLPPVGREALFEQMRRADVLVLPTLGDTFGLVATEALANGTPVLVSDRAGVADLVEPGVTGWVVAAGDVSGLARQLLWIAEHADQVRAMRRVIRARGPVRTWADFRADVVSAMRALDLAA